MSSNMDELTLLVEHGDSTLSPKSYQGSADQSLGERSLVDEQRLVDDQRLVGDQRKYATIRHTRKDGSGAFWMFIGIITGMSFMGLLAFCNTSHSSPSIYPSSATMDASLSHSATDTERNGGSSENDKKEPAGESHKFSMFQTLGYQIYTGGAPANLLDPFTNETTPNPECEGRTSYGFLGGWEPMCYIGLDDSMDDVKARLQLMRDAVDKAYQIAETEDTSVLKIFVAPEFFWRGVDGAYDFAGVGVNSFDRNSEHEGGSSPNSNSNNSTSTCGTICRLLQGLEEIVDDPRFGDDWMFLFGTAIASQTLPTEDEFDYVFYNFAPIYRGGEELLRNDVPSKTASQVKDADQHGSQNRALLSRHVGRRFLLPKRYVSKIDFLTPQRHSSSAQAKELVDQQFVDQKDDKMVWNPVDFHQYRYGQDIWKQYKTELQDELGYTMIEYGWLMVEDIVMTLEICYDHKQRTALTTFLANLVRGSTLRIPRTRSGLGLDAVPIPSHQAHISLISSAGMQLQPAAMALTNHGTVFLQDGLTDEGETMFSGSNAFGCNLGANCLEFDGGTESVKRTAVLSKTDVVFQHELVTSFKKHSIYDNGDWTSHLDGLFSVHSYEPMIAVFKPAPIAFAAP